MVRQRIDPDTDYPVSFRLPADLRDDLEREAKATNRSRSYVIVEVLRQWQAWWKKEREAKLPASKGESK